MCYLGYQVLFTGAPCADPGGRAVQTGGGEADPLPRAVRPAGCRDRPPGLAAGGGQLRAGGAGRQTRARPAAAGIMQSTSDDFHLLDIIKQNFITQI